MGIYCHGDSFLLHLVLLFCPSLSLPVIRYQISVSPSNDVLNIAPPCALSLLSGYVATRLYQEGTIMKGIGCCYIPLLCFHGFLVLFNVKL